MVWNSVYLLNGKSKVYYTEIIKSNFVAIIHHQSMGYHLLPGSNVLKALSGHIEELTDDSSVDPSAVHIRKLIAEYFHINPWYTRKNIEIALDHLCKGLKHGPNPDLLIQPIRNNKKIAFILNPGAPFEGMGEVLVTALLGFDCIVRLPEDCKPLFEAMLNYLCNDILELKDKVIFKNERLTSCDGLIACNTLENETAISYISKKPNLLLSQKGCTVTLTGEETAAELSIIAADICLYYGRSIFSIKSLRVPPGYNFQLLFESIERYNDNAGNHRYFNHYEYHKSLMLVNGTKHFDNGFLLLTSDLGHTGKTGVVTYSEVKKQDIRNASSGSLHTEVLTKLHFDNQGYMNEMVPSGERVFYRARRVSDFLKGL